ncbi:N-formylglutamate amidohydrolase [Stieleria neptunia]|uniref:N-formylglutamate amidohydrolase n=1 Tax=Stieleria neptunia TaxID=2527979 RepID=A0A518HT21_9BACT|nr:N-formylglutamate amidohydrolase [Stieleria neptunia]QDV43992.1 N-formylglutamate amidohydrolase [Stieleria neptunia]
MSDAIWRVQRGEGPLVATAVHDGHAMRDDVLSQVKLDDRGRLREEDPFTGLWTKCAPTRVIGLRSRFEVDLNRPRDKAVYRTPEDAWGLTVWKDHPADEMFATSLDQYDAFYAAMQAMLSGIVAEQGHFVLYDLHTYNHRRTGPTGAIADPLENPQVNIGTGTMDRRRWGHVVDALIEGLREFDFPGGKLDVRENVKFRGGNWPRWIHETFPTSGVAIAIEFKKFFMDEWSGQPDPAAVDAISDALQYSVPFVMDAFNHPRLV